MLVGKKGVGKTTLKRRLIGSRSEEKNKSKHKQSLNDRVDTEMTHGIQTKNWEDKENDILFSLWDFAGK